MSPKYVKWIKGNKMSMPFQYWNLLKIITFRVIECLIYNETSSIITFYSVRRNKIESVIFSYHCLNVISYTNLLMKLCSFIVRINEITLITVFMSLTFFIFNKHYKNLRPCFVAWQVINMMFTIFVLKSEQFQLRLNKYF